MPKKNNKPGRGSLGVRPRKRANRLVPRVRSWPNSKNAILGFCGYKVSMTHLIIENPDKNSRMKGKPQPVPVSVIECPPIKIAAAIYYKKHGAGMRCATQVNADKLDKEVLARLPPRKKTSKKDVPENVVDVRLLAYSQPKMTSLGKKKADIFELGLGGSLEDKKKKAEEVLGKEIKVSDVFKEGEMIDIYSVTKGKGYQGPVKRHGVAIRHHKSEKTKRGPGSLGPWMGNRSSTVPHAGQMGFMPRYEINKYIFKIDNNTEAINPKGGFQNYGNVKSDYMIVKGSVGGSKKRFLTLTVPKRKNKSYKQLPTIKYFSLKSS